MMSFLFPHFGRFYSVCAAFFRYCFFRATPKAMPFPKKRLFICCDGTGRDSIREKNDYVTNVARFARCLRSTGLDDALQLVYYHEGIAMHNGEFRLREAATGQGDILLCLRCDGLKKLEFLLT